MDFDDFWCKMKLRVCLFSFPCFQHTFVESRIVKTLSETKSSVFSLSRFQRCRQTESQILYYFKTDIQKKSHLKIHSRDPYNCRGNHSFFVRQVHRYAFSTTVQMKFLKFRAFSTGSRMSGCCLCESVTTSAKPMFPEHTLAAIPDYRV